MAIWRFLFFFCGGGGGGITFKIDFLGGGGEGEGRGSMKILGIIWGIVRTQ